MPSDLSCVSQDTVTLISNQAKRKLLAASTRGSFTKAGAIARSSRLEPKWVEKKETEVAIAGSSTRYKPVIAFNQVSPL